MPLHRHLLPVNLNCRTPRILLQIAKKYLAVFCEPIYKQKRHRTGMPFLCQWCRTGMPVLRHLLPVNLNCRTPRSLLRIAKKYLAVFCEPIYKQNRRRTGMPFLRQWRRTGMPVLRHLLPVNLNFPPNKPEIGGGEPATYILLVTLINFGLPVSPAEIAGRKEFATIQSV